MITKLKEALFDCGVLDFGVVRARKFTELREVLEKRGKVSLCEGDIEKRINPFLTYPFAKSIIMSLFSYNTNQKERVSEYALGTDYHIVIKERLQKASKILVNNGYKTEIFVDNGPLSDRYLAYLSGLGFFGMNQMLISKKFGSKVFIAGIVTDCELEENSPIDESICMQCRKCISACPGGAIGENFYFDENKCVSYLTQKKGELSDEEREIIKMSGYIWGCDICQTVCPYNYAIKCTNIQEFLKSEPYIENITEDMTNAQFKSLYKDKAYSWRGKAVLIRNMKIFD